MEWEERDSCADICSAECEKREERICDNLTGEDHLIKLMVDWGYESVLPHNRPPAFTMSHVVHFAYGIIVCIAGKGIHGKC